MSDRTQTALRLLADLTVEERRAVFQALRAEFPIHPLEAKLNAEAEVILESIDRAGGLVLRMMRGVIAEAAFDVEVVRHLEGWRDETPGGDLAYDFLLTDADGPVRVQVKLQRSSAGEPTRGARVARRYGFGPSSFVVETQKTRGGRNAEGQSTRPYRFGEFDVLAVSTYPSTERWDTFAYTVAGWLLPSPDDPTHIQTLQPVATAPNHDWTDHFETCVAWLRSGGARRIAVVQP